MVLYRFEVEVEGCHQKYRRLELVAARRRKPVPEDEHSPEMEAFRSESRHMDGEQLRVRVLSPSKVH